MSERDEQNRKIAEWMESCPSETETGGYYASGVQFSELKIWGREVGATYRRHWRCLLNFFTDEAASALVLDKMPQHTLLARTDKDWIVWLPDTKLGVEKFAQDADRKTAIALAALAYIESRIEGER